MDTFINQSRSTYPILQKEPSLHMHDNVGQKDGVKVKLQSEILDNIMTLNIMNTNRPKVHSFLKLYNGTKSQKHITNFGIGLGPILQEE